MNIEGTSLCAICHQQKPDDEMDGQTWYGDAICAACDQTFEKCGWCGYTVEPHQVVARDTRDEPICPECRPKYTETCDWCDRPIADLETAKLHRSLGQKLLQCGPCRTRQYANRNGGIRRHPTAIAGDALDAECAERIAREP